MNPGAQFWPRRDPTFNVGDSVLVGAELRLGEVTGVCMDPMYPVRVRFPGDARESRPIVTSLQRPSREDPMLPEVEKRRYAGGWVRS